MYCKVEIKNESYNCFYDANDNGRKQPLVLLHGWGVDSEIFNNIKDKLNYYVIVIDLIGFGKSDKPKEPFTLEDYVNQLHQMIRKLKLENIILLGHSFGGRVAIKYNYYYNVKKLILVDSAGIKKRSLNLYYNIIKYKLLKRIYKITNIEKYHKLIKTSGSDDYRKLSPIMKRTMTNILKEDLKKYCKITRIRVQIFWGLYDNQTPIKDAYKFINLFYDSRLLIFYSSGHFPHLTESEKFINAINCDYNE